MKKLLWLILLLFLAGCTAMQLDTGTKRDYSITNPGGGTQLVFVMASLEGVSSKTDSGGIDGKQDQRINPTGSIALDGAVASALAAGAELAQKELSALSKKVLTNTSTNNAEPKPETPAVVTPEPDTSDDIDFDKYDIIETAECDQEMSFRADGETESVIQKKCVFTKPGPEYGKSFVIQWLSGRTLKVPDSSVMAMTGTDYRKYQPQEPIEGGGFVPGTPAEVYAGRGDHSTKASILVKK